VFRGGGVKTYYTILKKKFKISKLTQQKIKKENKKKKNKQKKKKKIKRKKK